MCFKELLQNLINFWFIVSILIFFDQITFFKQINYAFNYIFLTHTMTSFHILDATHSFRRRDRCNLAQFFLVYRLCLIVLICTCEVTFRRATLNYSTADNTA